MLSGETGVVRSLPLLRPGTESRRIVPMARPRRCKATITRLAGPSHRGSRAPFSAIASLRRLLGARSGGLRVEGPPSPHPPEGPGPDLRYEVPDPPELGLPQHQLVLGLDQEEAGQPQALRGLVEVGPQLPDLVFEQPHPLLEQPGRLVGGERDYKREPGGELRVLLDGSERSSRSQERNSSRPSSVIP